jgi:hypothetical protein
VESEGNKIWVPQHSKAKADERYIRKNYGLNDRGGSVLFTAKKNYDNLINLDHMDDIWSLHEEISNNVRGKFKS